MAWVSLEGLEIAPNSLKLGGIIDATRNQGMSQFTFNVIAFVPRVLYLFLPALLTANSAMTFITTEQLIRHLFKWVKELLAGRTHSARCEFILFSLFNFNKEMWSQEILGVHTTSESTGYLEHSMLLVSDIRLSMLNSLTTLILTWLLLTLFCLSFFLEINTYILGWYLLVFIFWLFSAKVLWVL